MVYFIGVDGFKVFLSARVIFVLHSCTRVSAIFAKLDDFSQGFPMFCVISFLVVFIVNHRCVLFGFPKVAMDVILQNVLGSPVVVQCIPLAAWVTIACPVGLVDRALLPVLPCILFGDVKVL